LVHSSHRNAFDLNRVGLFNARHTCTRGDRFSTSLSTFDAALLKLPSPPGPRVSQGQASILMHMCFLAPWKGALPRYVGAGGGVLPLGGASTTWRPPIELVKVVFYTTLDEML
jgi:hypothetical protein